jgi:hypothetical protein
MCLLEKSQLLGARIVRHEGQLRIGIDQLGLRF